jgi:hypothetical protein
MARLNLTCACGWNFFLPSSTTGHQVSCPSCGEFVPIPGRKPGEDVPQSAGALAARIQRKQSLLKAVILGGIVAAVAIAAAVTLSMRGRPATEDDSGVGAPTATPRPAPRATPPPAPTGDVPPIPASPPPLFTGAQILEMRRNVYANVWLLNMTAILSECARLRGLTNEWAQFQADIAIYETRMKHNLVELAKVGEKVVVETYMAQGDQILRFAQKDLTTMKGPDAAQVIAVWASNWTPGVALEKVDLLRGGTGMTLYLQFPETSTELLTLLRHPAIQPGTSAEAAPAETMMALPAELLKDVNDRFSALPKGYRSLLLPVDRQRLDDLAASRKGSAEDVDWIKTRILAESVPSFQREAELVRSKILELEPKLKESAATDMIIRKNGTKVEGQIVEVTNTFVRIKSRFGSVPIPQEEIAKIEKGKGSAAEFPGKYAEAKDSVDKLATLLAWCVEKNLKVEKEYVAYSILAIDASHEKARTAVGLSRPVIGTLSPKPTGTEEAPRPSPGVEKEVELIAAEVTSTLPAFTDVINEMRRRTGKMTAAQLPIVPDKASKGLGFIQNPLTFDPSKLPATSLAEIGTWWSGLALEDRKQFAAYYGLWCAVYRAKKQ